MSLVCSVCYADAQSCEQYLESADAQVGIGDFRKAYENYSEGATCFLQDSNYGACLRTKGYALDCLEKLSEFDALEKGINQLERLIARYSPFISPKELNPIRFTQQLFTGLQKSRLGNIDAAIDIFQTALDSIDLVPKETWTQNDC